MAIPCAGVPDEGIVASRVRAVNLARNGVVGVSIHAFGPESEVVCGSVARGELRRTPLR